MSTTRKTLMIASAAAVLALTTPISAVYAAEHHSSTGSHHTGHEGLERRKPQSQHGKHAGSPTTAAMFATPKTIETTGMAIEAIAD